MTTLEFIFRRLLRSVGISNERNHLRIASQESHYLTEAEDLLGSIAWKDVADVPELAEEHWKIKEIVAEQEKLEKEITGIEATNEKLTRRRDELELELEEQLAAITAKKTEVMREAIGTMHELDSSREAAKLTKKKYAGLRMKLKALSADGASPDEIEQVEKAMDELKQQFALDKKRIAEFTATIRGSEERVAKIEQEIETSRNEARQSMAEMMNKVSKSSKQVADFTARIGSLEANKKTLCYQVGAFLSANHANSDADLKPVIRKYRNILSKTAQLRQSIKYHRILGGRDSKDL